MIRSDGKDELKIQFKKSSIKKIVIANIILVLILISIAFIKYGANITYSILSDYFFVAGIVILIIGVFSRTFAWVTHKRFLLKPNDDNENDVLKARVALKLISILFAIMGLINIVISLIFLALYYK